MVDEAPRAESPITLRFHNGQALLMLIVPAALTAFLGIGGNTAKEELKTELREVKAELRVVNDDQKLVREDVNKIGARLAVIESEALDARLRAVEAIGSDRRLGAIEHELDQMKMRATK